MRCAHDLEESLKTQVASDPVAMVAEVVQGVGGVIVPPPEYWPIVQNTCRKYGITLILDEVFTGFGRTGKMWAHEHWSLEPDMMAFAKVIGGGVPLGGVLTTNEVAHSVQPGDHFTTFGGNNQVGLAAANAVLDILGREALADRAERLGKRFKEGLDALVERHRIVGDVRGIGMFLGIDLVTDKAARIAGPALAKQAQSLLFDRGVIVSLAGVHHNVIRITPPLVISEAQIDDAVAAFDEAFSVMEAAS
jgi:4-aminobutyrate aminotransferase-like enzyme